MLIGSIGTRNVVTATERLGARRGRPVQGAGSTAAARLGVRHFMTRLIDSGESTQRLLEDFGNLDPTRPRRIRA